MVATKNSYAMDGLFTVMTVDELYEVNGGRSANQYNFKDGSGSLGGGVASTIGSIGALLGGGGALLAGAAAVHKEIRESRTENINTSNCDSKVKEKFEKPNYRYD